jgi:hypothetical protein
MDVSAVLFWLYTFVDQASCHNTNLRSDTLDIHILVLWPVTLYSLVDGGARTAMEVMDNQRGHNVDNELFLESGAARV